MFNEITSNLDAANINYNIVKLPFFDFDTLEVGKLDINVMVQAGRKWFFIDNENGELDLPPMHNIDRVMHAIKAHA
jgi:hypothetical protein